MGAEKLVKNELCTYIANTAEDITSDHKFLLRLVKTFTIATEEYYPKCCKEHDLRTFKGLVVSFVAFCAHDYIADWLI